MSRMIAWIGAGSAVAYIIVIPVVLYMQGLAADENPGSDWTIDATLWVLLIGLVAITAATITASTLAARRAR